MNKKTFFLGVIFLTFNLISSFAQKQIVIKGVVIDEQTGKFIPYANIVVKNTNATAITNNMGEYKLSFVRNKKTLIIVSHVNYQKKEFEITDGMLSGDLDITLIPKEVQLPDVVVSASLYEQSLEHLTKSADLISNDEIINNVSSNIADVLSKTPGFTQVWEYHSPIILRGLNSNRLVIMKNGNRRIGTFPGGYFGQDMNVYDARKIEVIKGPGSVIYGSGAISGIINVISEEPFGQRSNSVQLNSGYGSNNNELLELLKLSHKGQKFGISVNGKYRKTDNMVYGSNKIADNSNVEDRDVSLNTGYKFSNAHKILFNANYHYGDWGKPRGFNGPNKRFTKIRNEEENIHTDLSYVYTSKGVVEAVNFNLYYDKGYRDYYQYKYSIVTDKLSSLNLVHYKDKYGGARLFTILRLAENNKLTTGIDGYMFRIDSPTEIIDYYNNTKGNSDGTKNAGQQNAGLFVNDEWELVEKIKLITGIRFDMATVIEGNIDDIKGRDEKRQALSGNLGIVYSFNNNTHLSTNVGRAFRMPITEELFTRVISCKGIKKGNPNLKPEYSWNFDLGLRGHSPNRKLKYDLALFYNILDNFINEAPSIEDDVDFTLINTDAKLMGSEFSVTYLFSNVIFNSNSLYANVGGAYVYGVDLSDDNPKPLFGMPPLKINAELDYRGIINKKWLSGYSIKFETEYALAQNRIAEIPKGTDGGPWGYIPSEPHTIFNLSIGLKSNSIIGTPRLRFIVNNIFNTDYQPFGSYIPAMGRNFKVIASFRF